MSTREYEGRELELFEREQNWKKYLKSIMAPYLQGRVLEVGAGTGNSTRILCDGTQQSWLCLEPDPGNAEQILKHIQSGALPGPCQVRTGMIQDLEPRETYHAVVYIDVLEHIENDRGEIDDALSHLERGGHLVITVPAFQSLYTPFDREIGHFRRYEKESLQALMPASLQCRKLQYLDSLGTLLLLGNKLLLRQKLPRAWQVQFWDGLVVPLSKIIDRLIGYRVGRSLLGIWQVME